MIMIICIALRRLKYGIIDRWALLNVSRAFIYPWTHFWKHQTWYFLIQKHIQALIYADGAPEMKNHLSMVGSTPAGCNSWCLGTLTAPGSVRSGELWTVTLVLDKLAREILKRLVNRSYRSNLSFGVLPVISLSQASAHSRTMSMAYLFCVSNFPG